jgi:hypothetical protein
MTEGVANLIRTLTVTNARTLARILNLAESCKCTCTFVLAEHYGDLSYYHIFVELHGSDEALCLLDSQVEGILTYERSCSR